MILLLGLKVGSNAILAFYFLSKLHYMYWLCKLRSGYTQVQDILIIL